MSSVECRVESLRSMSEQYQERVSRLSERVRECISGVQNEYTIDIDEYEESERVSGGMSVESDDVSECETATPVLRPYSSTSRSTSFTRVSERVSDTGRGIYNPSHYHTRTHRHDSASVSDHSGDHSGHSDHSPLSHTHSLTQYSDEEGDDVVACTAEPLTPSRLLTLNSFDFMDTDVTDVTDGVAVAVRGGGGGGGVSRRVSDGVTECYSGSNSVVSGRSGHSSDSLDRRATRPIAVASTTATATSEGMRRSSSSSSRGSHQGSQGSSNGSSGVGIEVSLPHSPITATTTTTPTTTTPTHTRTATTTTTTAVTHSEITDSDLKQELVVHGDIVTDYASQLTAALNTHLSDVMSKLTTQKVVELRGRDAFYTKELQKQQIIIEDLEEVVATYEKNILSEEATVVRYREMLECVCVQQRVQYISPFSLIRLLQHWKIFTATGRRMTKLYKMASRHRRKSVLRTTFDEFKKEADRLHEERKGVEAKNSFDKTVRDLVARYEKQISQLTMDLQESHEALAQEKSRRQQLEEDLRRMFLKNMTVMNMEALSLFQTPVSAPPQLAEFGPDKKQADAERQAEATQRRQQELLQHMRQQQQQLQSHQHEYNTDYQAKMEQGKSTTQRHFAQGRHKPHIHTGDQRMRGAIYNMNSPQSSTSSPRNSRVSDHSHRRSPRQEEWDEEEEHPRTTPHPLPYNNSDMYKR